MRSLVTLVQTAKHLHCHHIHRASRTVHSAFFSHVHVRQLILCCSITWFLSFEVLPPSSWALCSPACLPYWLRSWPSLLSVCLDLVP